MENDPDLRSLREEIRREREMIKRLEEENRRRMVRLAAEENSSRRQNGG